MDHQDKTKRERGAVLCNRRVDNEPYTILPNRIVQGSDMTPNAYRVLTYVASLPEDWNLRIEAAAKVCRVGRDAFYKALKELADLGFARHVTVMGDQNRIQGGRWEFTLTPGQWRELEKPADASLLLNFRKRRQEPFPGSPNTGSPNTEKPTLQRTDIDKKNREKNNKSVANDFSIYNCPLSVGATVTGIVQKAFATPPESKKGAAMEEMPALWPFPDMHQTTESIRKLGVEPQAVWSQFREQALAGKVGKVKNLGGYLVTMARAMAKAAYGPPDPAALKRAAAALSARSSGTRIDPAVYDRINAEEDAERLAARSRPFKSGGYRGELKTYKPPGSGRLFKAPGRSPFNDTDPETRF